MKSEDIFLEWLATYGEGKDEVIAGMWNKDLMIEFAKFYANTKDKWKELENSRLDEPLKIWNPDNSVLHDVIAQLSFSGKLDNRISVETATEIIEQYANTKAIGMPTELTAENGAKALLNGEFFEEWGLDASDSDEEFNNIDVPVSWTTIKAIYKKIVDYYTK